MKLLTALRRQPADNCFILTYNADLLFFEHMLFEPLYAAGCRNVVLLMDPVQYNAAIADVAQLRYAGFRYPVIPARTSPHGAFHPKLVLTTSGKGGQLFITSGNATAAGYMRNWEVATLFEYDSRRPDATAWAACHWAYQVLSRIIVASDPDGMAAQRLDQLEGTTRWLREEAPPWSEDPVWLLHNLDEPLMSQVTNHYRERDGSPVREAVAVSPFLDRDAVALGRLLTTFSPESLSLYTQRGSHGLSPSAFQSVVERGHARVELYDADIPNRRLHAKALLLRTERGAWVLSGSPNLSRPALLERAAPGNTEMAVLRYEPDPRYFDAWIEALITHGEPMHLSPDEEPSTGHTALDGPLPITLLSCSLRGHQLQFRTVSPAPGGGPLILHLSGMPDTVYKPGAWTKDAEQNLLSLTLDPVLARQLSGPTLASLSLAVPPNSPSSNSVIIHVPEALARYGRPAQRRQRPRIPDDLRPESYEQCAQLLEMLHDLLATDRKQLHRLTRPRGRRDRPDEQTVTIDAEDYDPEEHLVEERIRTVAPANSADLYADWDDRLTYGSIIQAIVAAMNRTSMGAEELGVEAPGTVAADAGGSPALVLPIQFIIPPDDDELREQLLRRIEQGFRQIVTRFARGLQDPEYLIATPVQYVLELFVIVTTYLRIAHRDGMLTQESFLGHSLSLLDSLWGRPGCSGGWYHMNDERAAADLSEVESRLFLSAQTWLHTYLCADLLERAGDRRQYDLAAWMRSVKGVLRDPVVLEGLPHVVWSRLWRFSTSSGTAAPEPADAARRLQEFSERCDEASPLAEIREWAGSSARIMDEKAVDTTVRSLLADYPLTEGHLDRCFLAFRTLLLWPQPRSFARAEFSNSNPRTGDDDIGRVVFLYRGDTRELVVAVERAPGVWRPDVIVPGVAAEDVGALGSFGEALTLAE